MENKRLLLPAGVQSFETIRTEGFIYVDKTRYLIDLIDKGRIYFLARPRRFGKSLTVSTFEALFSGRKELFKGLYAEEFLNRPGFQPNPVIRLDMSKVITNCGIIEMEKTMAKQIRNIADRLDVSLPDSHLPGSLFEDLIVRTSRKYNQKVVVLLDEYDKPYTDFVNDSAMAETVRMSLRNFYIQIKANSEYIHFTFITGISKFAKFGVFSTLNTLTDISMMPEYAEICGYTEDEIIQYFTDYLEETASYMNISTETLIDRMCRYYDGFSFDREARARLYNPFSTLLFFSEKQFFNYWVDTGKSKFIADYLQDRNLTVEQFRDFPVSIDFVRSPGDLDDTPPEGFLYQSGYLTLRPGTIDDLSLDYPNTEVLNSMSKLLVQNILRDKDEDYTRCRSNLLAGLMTVDHDRVIASLNRLLASIPYDDFSNAAKQSISDNSYDFQPQEWLYRSSILAFLRGCGVVVVAEMHTNRGRADLVVSHRGKTWVIEIKVACEGQSAERKAEEALKQIMEKNYAQPYPDAICLGLGIDDTVRQITAKSTTCK